MATETLTVSSLRTSIESGTAELREIEKRISELQMDAFKIRQRVDSAMFMILDSDNGSRVVALESKVS